MAKVVNTLLIPPLKISNINMKHLKLHPLLELNKAAKYFKQNPDKLRTFPHIEDEDQDHSYTYPLSDDSYTKLNDNRRELRDRIENEFSFSDPNISRHFFTIYEYVVSNLEAHEKQIEYATSLIAGIPNPIRVDLCNQFDVDITDDYYTYGLLAQKIVTEIVAAIKKHKPYFISSNVFSEKLLNKLCTIKGLSLTAVKAALSQLKKYRNGHITDLPESYHDVLRELTVVKSRIPKTLWRGLNIPVYDKNPQQELAKWNIGTVPGSRGITTSWSTSKSVAIDFMRSSPSIYVSVLLRYDSPSYEDIVVDTRVLENEEYWGEQEIMLSSNANKCIIEYSTIHNIYDPKSVDTLDDWSKKGKKGKYNPKDYDKLYFDSNAVNATTFDISPATRMDMKTKITPNVALKSFRSGLATVAYNLSDMYEKSPNVGLISFGGYDSKVTCEVEVLSVSAYNISYLVSIKQSSEYSIETKNEIDSKIKRAFVNKKNVKLKIEFV